jgi:hypothetical protein
MAKTTGKPRASRPKKEAESAPTREVTAALAKPKRSLKLHEWLDEVREHAATAAAAGSPPGACLVPNSQTGGNDCVLTDEDTCTSKLKGIWIGGPCGPD